MSDQSNCKENFVHVRMQSTASLVGAFPDTQVRAECHMLAIFYTVCDVYWSETLTPATVADEG